jgi:hypothetical protein
MISMLWESSVCYLTVRKSVRRSNTNTFPCKAQETFSRFGVMPDLISRRRAYSKPRSRELLWPAQPKQPVKDPLSSAQSATYQIAKFKLAISREDTAGLPQVIKPPASGQPGGTSPKVCSLSTPYAGYRPRIA